MVDIATIEAGLVVAEQIVNGLVVLAPKISAGIVSAEPYVAALAGMITGNGATDEQIDAILAQLKKDSDDFQTPLPPDDGTTTT